MINHGFTLITDPKPFDWIGESLKPHTDSYTFAQYMPKKFEAYISFQHYFENENMIEVADPDMNALVDALQKFTSTPTKAYMGMWEGFGWSFEANFNLKRRLDDSCKIEQPHRKYYLIESSVANCLAAGNYLDGYFSNQFPNMMWSEDKSWYLFQEIDFDITLIGGSAELIQEIENCGKYITKRFDLEEYMGNRFLAYWMEKSALSGSGDVDDQTMKTSKLHNIATGIRAKFHWKIARGVSYFQPVKPTLIERIKKVIRKN